MTPSSENKVPYQLGESLLPEQDEISLTCPPLHKTKEGYLEPQARSGLLKYHPEVALYCPQIPQNTGSIARLCAAFTSTLHLIEPMGFQITEKAVKRAGLDYWEHVNLFVHKSWDQFKVTRPKRRLVFIETGSVQSPYAFQFLPGDVLVFGAETFGVHREVLDKEIKQHAHAHLTIPMFNTGVRSINLANCVSIVLYHAVAQLHEKGYSV